MKLCDVAVVLVLLEEEREKVKLPFVDNERCDCSDTRELDRCLPTRLSYDFLVWEAARWGTTGAPVSDDGFGFDSGRVKYCERWFGCFVSGKSDLLDGDSTSGLVGGVEAVVGALSDSSSSDL